MRIRAITALLAVLAAASAAAADGEVQYMALFMEDAKVGHARSERTVTDGQVRNETVMELSLARGETVIPARAVERFTETADGEPLAFEASVTMSGAIVVSNAGVIRDGQMHLVSKGMLGSRGSTIPYPAGALMSEAARRLQQAKGLRPGTRYSFLAFEPATATGVQTEVAVGEPADVALIGRTMRLTPLEVDLHLGETPMRSTVYVDQLLRAQKSSTAMMGIRLHLVACDRAYAEGPNGRFDLMAATLVPSSAVIPSPRELSSATYTLAPAAGAQELRIPSAGRQTAAVGPGGTVTVHVRPGARVKAATRPYDGEDPSALEALRASQYVQSEHPRIVETARGIVSEPSDALSAARAIERWVHEHLKSGRDLSVGYASALETLRRAKGDCTEHAVLTAALCRAAGVPCRIVVGVAYVERFGEHRQCFVGHAWNQALIGGEWIDLDASLGADAARIILSAGGDGPLDFIAVAGSLGNFTITGVQTP